MYSLGIDTGGTNTDSVLVDATAKTFVASGKAPTTHYNLAIGIKNSIADLLSRVELKEPIAMVSLSSTLATNSIVEGRARDVCLILIGQTPRKEWGKLPGKLTKVIKGQFDEMGRETEPLDMAALEGIVEEVDEQVEAYAVSGYFGVRNPSHEKRVMDFIKEKTGKSVVCGHEFTLQLGVYERSVTAVLNAGLIPVIEELLDAVKDTLAHFGIDAPLFVVKGDGAMVSEVVAREHPIETVYSGPAASAVGGFHMTGKKSALIVDIGGTTTDVVELIDGMPKVVPDGAVVGGLKTRVRAIDATTFGFGGDSEIRVNEKAITVGPERAVPIKEFELSDVIKSTKSTKFYATYSDSGAKLMGEEEVKSTHSQEEISKLLIKGKLELVALTPSDILCYMGQLKGNVESVEACLDVLAEKKGISVEDVVGNIEEAIMGTLSHNMHYDENVVVGIGAPSPYFAPRLAQKLDKSHIVPEHCEVANAFGASVCSIMESVEIVVSRLWEIGQEGEHYVVHAPTGMSTYRKFLDAVQGAVKIGKEIAIERAVRSGAAEPEVKTEREDFSIMIDNTRFFLRSTITARAIGEAAPIAMLQIKES
ncbi:MAG: hydantoinase/oxoprolinase family protein [Methermicoccaceae archaeon]